MPKKKTGGRKPLSSQSTSTVLGVRLTVRERKAAQRAAKREGCSASAIGRAAVRAYLGL